MAKPSKATLVEPLPPRTTRQTRASVEPSERARPATRAARNNPGTADTAANANANAKRRGRSKKGVEPPALAEVEEDTNIDQAQLDAQLQAQAQLQDEHAVDAEDLERRRISRGNASVISGTTAKTSFSQEETSRMDPEVMIDVLPGLLSSCEELLRLLIPHGSETNPVIWKEIRTSGSRHSKLYHNRLASINVHKPNFGSQEYISPRHVLKALLGVADTTNIPEEPWRPDNFIFKINLTQMLNSLLIVCDPSDWAEEHTSMLERLHTWFLDAIAGREFSYETLSFFLELSAHVTIARLDAHINSEPHFSPHAVIESQFFDDEDRLVHFDSLGLQTVDEEVRNDAVQRIRESVDDMKKPFPVDNATNATASNGRLKAIYRWDALGRSAIEYAESRMRDLHERLEQAGGTTSILEGLAEETERRANEKIAQGIRQSVGKQSSKGRSSFGGKNNLARIREMEKQAQMAERNASAPAPTAQMTATAGTQQEPSRSSDAAPQRSLQANAAEVAQASASSRAHHNGKQKARWTDPQPSAQRISPIPGDSPRPMQKGRGDSAMPSSSRPAKRGYEQVEDEEEVPDPTQDDGFQVDTRDLTAADARRRQVSFPNAPRPQARATSSAAPPRSTSTSVNPGPSPAKRQRKNPGSSMPDPIQPLGAGDDDIPQDQIWARQKAMSKFNRIGTVDRAPQRRTEWSEDEENALIELIEEHGEGGISYAGLKTIDNDLPPDERRLSRRTAEDMRFKARNMKVVMLQADGRLPENFVHVVLGKKEIEKVRSRGIAYEQERIRGLRFDVD
ncbi:uncharacterized protein RCC_02219 [Lecanosticta acicola]|uniref:Uncharacterized protein RCC_02219 n=1 Tax=Lecanosticta acicola TaxID=111012 RepID=A0AAI8YVF8_9PEZI|nr:uncharacterized protein RCC_02219 [Lecanosticta acicola]